MVIESVKPCGSRIAGKKTLENSERCWRLKIKLENGPKPFKLLNETVCLENSQINSKMIRKR